MMMMIITLITLMVVVMIGMFVQIHFEGKKINKTNENTRLKSELRDLNESLKTARAWNKESIIDRIFEIERILG